MTVEVVKEGCSYRNKKSDIRSSMVAVSKLDHPSLARVCDVFNDGDDGDDEEKDDGDDSDNDEKW